MLSISTALLALAASTAPAPPPSPASMAPAFANTLVSTYPDGLHGRLYLSADGGWKGVSRHAQVSSGRWRVAGSRLCLRQSRPIPIPFSYCTPIVAGGVGASWSAKAPSGEPITVVVAPGRAGEPAGWPLLPGDRRRRSHTRR